MLGEIIAPDLVILVALAVVGFLVWVFVLAVRSAQWWFVVVAE
jgi:hypothetical protein